MEPITKILLIFMITILIIGIFIFVIIPHFKKVKSRKRRAANDNKFNSFSHQGNNLSGNSNLVQKLTFLENEMEKIKRKVSEIDDRINKLEIGNLPVTNRVNTHVEIIPPVLEPIIEEQQKPIIEFYTDHQKGVFDRTASKTINNSNTIYKIEVHGLTGTIYLLTGRKDSLLITDKDIYLEDLCEITEVSGGEGMKIIEALPGSVLLKGNYWIVKDRIKIKI